ncbi:ABC transporter permease [Actinomyces gaoshouyii]|uniref:ABC transporter permease n=1 Tax=Actinomyces gaoshouyii TaxID=1960083 RepID=UPI0009BC9CB2|nr:ABC transporter permease subunit [Actinomyces gaoshouyii]ARD42317.1 ABC transporter permease [Actinomyces gaoshouyii]
MSAAEQEPQPLAGPDGPAPAGAAGPTAESRSRGLLVQGALALALWAAHPVIIVAVPDTALRTADHRPLLIVVGAWIALLAMWFARALARPASSAALALAHRLPWIALGGAWMILWQMTTAKLDWLSPPYFASPEVLIEALRGDADLLASSLGASSLLFLAGYALGSVMGFATGLLMGWSRRADYWLHPLLQSIGPVPAASLLPLALLVAPSTFASAVLIIAFGAWFPMATMTRAGVRAVPRSYIDAARTLGASEGFLVGRVAVPAALPDMLTGLFTGLGTSLAALMTAELVGVDKGLAWYINWVKGWADYPRMYVGLVVLVVFCRALMILLFKLRSSLLAWQHDLVRW